MPGNGYAESFNARLRDELLDGEVSYTLREAEVAIESWRRHNDGVRPHPSLGYKPPAQEVFSANPTPPDRPGPKGPAQPITAVLH